MTWATVQTLRETATDLRVRVPADDAQCERLLKRAQDALEVHVIGARLFGVEELPAEQREALARACALQACWIVELSTDFLGPDGIASVPEGLSFSRDPRPRVTDAAREALAHWGVVVRAAMAMPEPTDTPDEEVL